ncbi:sugar ABC transporter permease [Arthrobacter sp. FW306-05-C]|uniref:carbohydrate ABC transporter permease n=1 Tax=Arthrobacter TaxID=1663 RepID=UPI001EF01928|nr:MULTISPECIES: sugar ABC transporter permease [Arthrobacter]MDP9987024.1 cellobiose transport system permease protein [Arthrobacter oryzae]UKA67130.1 sugar ABC transporter permease [Arthrobacter sp. FW306-05-C]UKA75762.1 sugar ABC transporter permease [Arthrobacter sp. FW306-07-I]
MAVTDRVITPPAGRSPNAGNDGKNVRRLALSRRVSKWDVKLSPYLYISPFFLLFAVTGLFPLAYSAWVSLHNWNLIGGQGKFAGLDNYAFVVAQPYFWNAVGNTFSIFVLSSVPQVFLALVIAAVLDANLRARTFWRMGVLVPFVVAPVAVGLIFNNLFADQFGLINEMLKAVGLDPVRWHSDSLASHAAIATMVNFRWTGYNALIFLAAMQAIPRDVFEAATIDGAGRLRQFFSVTVPMLRPTAIFVVITSTIGGLQIFDEPRVFDQSGLGGADRQWQTLTMYIWELGWGQRNFGRASAVAWLLFLIIVLIALLNFVITKRIASQGGRK